SGAIAFLAPGQRVNLRLDDFPYQKFGVQEASIRAVRTTMAALDGSGRQPFYRVSASLQQQYVLAYGREQGLLPGMALSASIVLEERSLLEWLLEPLFSIVGRS